MNIIFFCHELSKLCIKLFFVVLPPDSCCDFFGFEPQGMYQNDFLGLTFKNFVLNGVSSGPPISGEYVVEQLYQIDTRRSKWEDLAVVLGMVIGYRVIFFTMIKFSENFGPNLRSRFINPLVAYFTSRTPAVSNTIRPLSLQASPAHDNVPLRYQQIVMPTEFRKLHSTTTTYTAWTWFIYSCSNTCPLSIDLQLTVNERKPSVAEGARPK